MSAKVEIPAPNIRTALSVRPAEHEVFLSFNSDWHAVAFQDWLANEGFDKFQRWASARSEEYR